MLIGIPPLISPDLLAVLHRMGHGDEIVFADAHPIDRQLTHIGPTLRRFNVAIASISMRGQNRLLPSS